MIALLGAVALGAPCPLEAADLVGLTARAGYLLDHDDFVGHGTVWREIQDGLTCLAGPLPTDSWASFLVGLALLERTLANPDWTEPLQVAIEIDPAVKRDLGDRTFRAFAPPPPTPPGDLLPTDAAFWLDGRRIDRRPMLTGGPHVLQRELAGNWTTVVLRGQPFPTDWHPLPAAPPEPVLPPEPARIGVSGVVWGIGGAAAGSQELARFASDIASEAGTRALVGVGTHGRLGGLFGVGSDLIVALRPGGSPAADGALGFALGPATLGLGAATAVIQQADEDQLAVLARPHLGLSAASPVGEWTGMAGVSGGWLPACANAAGWVALVPPSAGPVLGVEGGYSRLAFVEEDGPNALVVERWWVGLAVGIGRER